MNKKIYFVLVVVLAILLIVSFAKGTAFKKDPLKGLSIAENAFNFLNKSIDPEGGFYYKFNCNDKEKPCTIGEPYDPVGHSLSKMPPHFGHLILAFHDMGKKSEIPFYTETAGEAMEFILAQCQKDSEYCLWNFSPLIVYYNETKDVRYKNAMLKVSDQLLADHTLADHLALNAGIKLRSLYEITGDRKYLVLLTKNTDAILSGELNQEKYPILYKEGDFEVRGILIKAVWADILPAYVATKDERYLNFTKEFFSQAKLSEHLGKLGINNELETLSYALDSLWQLSLADVSGKESYLRESHKIAEYVYEKYADTPQNKKFDGDYGFVENQVKDPLVNGWIVRQFIRLSDDNF